jgi:hypothetical protein
MLTRKLMKGFTGTTLIVLYFLAIVIEKNMEGSTHCIQELNLYDKGMPTYCVSN